MGLKRGLKFDEKSCGVVIFRKSQNNEIKYLVLHYPAGHWDFPKGHVEQGEKEIETAARELLEETGISDVEFVKDFREEVSYKYRNGGKLSNKQVVFFLGETSLKNIRLSHEHRDFDWLPYDVAFNKLTFNNAKNLLKKAKIMILSKYEDKSSQKN